MEFAPLRIKKRHEHRLRNGHLWLYSNEVDTQATPLHLLTPGQPVEIVAYNDKVIGTGYANPHSLLCARLLSRDPKHPFSPSLIVHRLKVALSLREARYEDPFYRLVHGEGDWLPGLIVDRYDQILVVQITTAGMELMKDEIVAALEKVVRPEAILLRNDTPVRQQEGLESYVTSALGDVPEEVEISENGTRFTIPLSEGQKTGWFFDQQTNRERLRHYVADRRVLDVFSYIGAWGIQAAMAGATDVMCIDRSEAALTRLHENAASNDVAETVSSLEGDAFDALQALREDKERFDVIILDPPAFIKRKKDHKAGLEAYQRLNRLGMQLLSKDGFLISCSCSYHLPWSDMREALLKASRHVDRNLQLLELGHQAPDHPIHPAIPETEYLKACYTRITLS